LPNKIKDKFDALGKFFQAIPDSFDILNRKMNSGWKDFAQAFPDGFNKLEKEMDSARAGINDGASDADKAMNGVYSEVLEGINITVNDLQLVFQYIEDFSVFCWKYLYCGLLKITNLPYCFIFYLMEAIGYAIYMPVLFAFYLIKVTSGCDFQSQIDKFWEVVECIDQNVYDATGYYLFRFSPYVMKTCFNCDVVPMPVFPDNVFVKDYANIHDSISGFPEKMKHAMNDKVIPSFTRLINSGNASMNVIQNDFSKSYGEMQGAFKDSFTHFKDAVKNAFGG
jgi:hypothetical protein